MMLYSLRVPFTPIVHYFNKDSLHSRLSPQMQFCEPLQIKLVCLSMIPLITRDFLIAAP